MFVSIVCVFVSIVCVFVSIVCVFVSIVCVFAHVQVCVQKTIEKSYLECLIANISCSADRMFNHFSELCWERPWWPKQSPNNGRKKKA